ncbi:MAG: hypothetical protein LQ340_004590 [Diploschistes diacapsis]|nr:MAG: hypothetical protein LQ340_004590 [Diploschistes diacapsis]
MKDLEAHFPRNTTLSGSDAHGRLVVEATSGSDEQTQKHLLALPNRTGLMVACQKNMKNISPALESLIGSSSVAFAHPSLSRVAQHIRAIDPLNTLLHLVYPISKPLRFQYLNVPRNLPNHQAPDLSRITKMAQKGNSTTAAAANAITVQDWNLPAFPLPPHRAAPMPRFRRLHPIIKQLFRVEG